MSNAVLANGPSAIADEETNSYFSGLSCARDRRVKAHKPGDIIIYDTPRNLTRREAFSSAWRPSWTPRLRDLVGHIGKRGPLRVSAQGSMISRSALDIGDAF